MALDELVKFLDDEKEKLFKATPNLKEFYNTLSEAIRTLTVPFRNSFSPDINIKSSIDPENKRITFSKHPLQSIEGQVQNNTDWLINLINNIYAIQNKYLQSPYFIELTDINDIKRVHSDISKFLDELYLQNTSLILKDSSSEMSILARQKKRDIEDLLGNHINPYYKRLEHIKKDEYNVRLRPEIKDHIGNLQIYNKTPEKYDILIKEKCTLIGLAYNPDLTKTVIADLATNKESFKKRIKKKYSSDLKGKKIDTASIRRKYLKIVTRYLSRTNEISKLAPILENVYYLFQPKPTLAERFYILLSMIFGKERKVPKRDIEFSYIIGKESIQRKKASLEELMYKVNSLEKLMLKVRNNINSYYINRKLNTYPLRKMRDIIDNIRTNMRNIFDDCFGLIQWLGKKSNKEKLEKIPETMQKEFNQHLTSINATLIINSERLKEIDRRYPINSRTNEQP